MGNNPGPISVENWPVNQRLYERSFLGWNFAQLSFLTFTSGFGQEGRRHISDELSRIFAQSSIFLERFEIFIWIQTIFLDLYHICKFFCVFLFQFAQIFQLHEGVFHPNHRIVQL